MAKKQFKAESKRLLDLMIHSIYTHREIFLRELISNASDAIDKLCFKSLTDENVGMARSDFRIRLTCDKDNGILIISDNGIGMTKEDMENNLGVIARSGSLAFKKELDAAEAEKADIDIIGQFGVGFYAAFMVAAQVTVISKKYGEDTAWKWVSDGADGYTVTECTKDSYGTDVIMELKADTEDDKFSRFLQEYELRSLVKKYSDYIRYPIRMAISKSRKKEDSDEYESYLEEDTLNSMVPLWQRAKKDVTEEEYTAFYREKFFDYQKPLKTVHWSAEGTVSFKAMLFIPGKAPFDFYSKDYKPGLQLYSAGVLIMENCQDLLPEHFRFVRGVVDSLDLSLNISRELLQHDRQLKIIAKGIEKKLRSELKSLLENDNDTYLEFYNAFGRSLKYGCVADYGANKDAVKDLLLFYSHKEDKLICLQAYVDAMAQEQEKIYYIAGESRDRLAKLPQVKLLEEKGYDVLLFTDEVDEFIPQALTEYGEKHFCNAATEDLGLQTEEEKKATEEKAEALKGLLDFVKETLGEEVTEVKLSASLGNAPASVRSATGMSFEMEKYMRRMNPELPFPTTRILELNGEHEAVKAMQLAIGTDETKAESYAKLLYAQACLMADLPIDDPVEYTKLVCELMK